MTPTNSYLLPGSPPIELNPRYADRISAGHQLGQLLLPYRDGHSLVLALPPGGVVIAGEVARLLRLPLDVLYEDEHLIVIDKAAGMVVHPAPGHDSGTLVHALLGKLQAADETDERPGIVHRLDKDTSGVMVVARTPEAHETLVRMFQAHDLERRYLAIARGHTPDAFTYDTFHARHPTDRKRFTSKTDRGKRAVTHLRTLERLHGASFVECRLMTGRTHQIRVHLADAGHPLLGDPVYGRSASDPRVRAVEKALGRQALHAAHLEFAHPITGERLSFTTAPPRDFEEALAALRG